jgi:hypothetical protein
MDVVSVEQWRTLVHRYDLIKELHIICEENDPELLTNLQPLNEFRAALDHLIRILAIVKLGITEYSAISQFDKLQSHLRRALFDICDMLAMHYQNKIIDIIKEFDTNTISMAIPEYYTEIRPEIESIRNRIAGYRKNKGNEGVEENDVNSYHKDVLYLLNTYNIILQREPSLVELWREVTNKADSVQKKYRVSKAIGIVGIVVGVVGVIVGWVSCSGQ